MTMLEIENVHAYYGNIHALKGVSLTVDKGEIVTLIGANGAGKSTTLRTTSGLLRPRQGSIRLDGEDLTRYPPHEIVVKGVVQVPEGRRVFGRLTVTENLEMGAFTINDKRLINENLERVFTLFPRLKERRKQLAGTLSGGEQQMLTIARTLMTNPQLLLLDEPGEGLAPLVIKAMKEQLGEIKKLGTTMLICEHNVGLATALSDRAYVMDKGTIRYQGTIEDLRKNEEVRKKYLMV